MNAMYLNFVMLGGTIERPNVRGRFNVNHGVSLSRQSLATDPVGLFTLTLNNLVSGSAIQIESQDGTTVLHNSNAASSSSVIVLSTYAPGSALNNLRIKVRKGSSSPYYQPYETLTTAIVGSQSIFVSQILDE